MEKLRDESILGFDRDNHLRIYKSLEDGSDEQKAEAQALIEKSD